jgi:hypothetical protein
LAKGIKKQKGFGIMQTDCEESSMQLFILKKYLTQTLFAQTQD